MTVKEVYRKAERGWDLEVSSGRGVVLLQDSVAFAEHVRVVTKRRVFKVLGKGSSVRVGLCFVREGMAAIKKVPRRRE